MTDSAKPQVPDAVCAGYGLVADFFDEQRQLELDGMPVACPEHGSGEHIHPIASNRTTFTCGKCHAEYGVVEVLRKGVDVGEPADKPSPITTMQQQFCDKHDLKMEHVSLERGWVCPECQRGELG